MFNLIHRIARRVKDALIIPVDEPGLVAPMAEETPLTVEDVARSMRAEGYSLRAIAAETGLSYYMARKVCS